MDQGESFTTISQRVRTELKVRASRFIATAMPVSSREEATAELDRIRKEFWDATHHCYAWRLAPDGLQYRFADDGEPSGTAGKPILFVMQQRGLLDVLVVVTRYFGGTRLGAGGLARAYGDAAAAALDLAEVVQVFPTDSLLVVTPYEDVSAVRQLVERYAVSFQEEFRDVVNYTMSIRSHQVEEFSELLTETSNGRAGVVTIARSGVE